MHFSVNYIYIAHRYLWYQHKNQTIGAMIKVCGLSIAIATCSLALVISIENGFQQATYEKMQSIYPDLIIESELENQDEELLNFLLQNHELHIKAYTLQHQTQALITTMYTTTSPLMIVFRGIDPDRQTTVSSLATKIIEPRHTPMAELLTDNGILIGSQLADLLHLKIGDQAFILYNMHHTKNLQMKFQKKPVTIVGLFKTGIDDIDSSLVYCNHSLFDTMIHDDFITHIHIKLSHHSYESTTKQKIQQRLNAHVYSWKDLYPALISAMTLEKWAMIFILFLIMCVATMNIISLIFMYITQKQRDIAILLSMNMSIFDVRKIFLTISFIIATIASLIGLSSAFIIAKLLQLYPCIKLPDNIYDTDYLPIKLELPVFFVILSITIGISLCASLYATRKLNQLNKVELLKSH